MRLLLDTHVLIWWLDDDKRLSAEAREAVAVATDVRVSAASGWEMAIKRNLGRLDLPPDYVEHVERAGFRPLAVTLRHAAAAGELPRHHDDPFDRILVAQARLEDLTLVTADRRLPDYGVPILVVG